MKQKLLFILSALMLAFSAFSAENNSLFQGKEFKVDLYGTYQSANALGVGVGLDYFLTKNVGVTIGTTKNNFDASGKFFENANAGLILRLPITSVLAPYVTGGTDYAVDSGRFSPYLGAGLQYRITQKFGAFVEGDYNFGAWNNWQVPEAKSVLAKFGIQFGF